ncbi:MAG: transketolase [Candidatus Marinamargulisbacteria bacterium]|nr:transketolase [bacterium]MDG2265213.1 transketolase [Candidatus Marinamargulisbacteria bacterium]|tara:strand:+ start:3008 stop:5038 length:2031 start_codon:yes stop_codon:yes gene_type:complete
MIKSDTPPINFTAVAQLARGIRGLSMDAIEAANSGHPGLPLGCADIVACLYARQLRFHPQVPDWAGRDRFVLSAGHGSMVLYSVLHLVGYGVSLDSIRQFRQCESPTPGHPEYRETPGVEATTGPLGQGIAMGIGLALGAQHQNALYQWGMDADNLPHTYILAGDGCLMEGVSSEASSLAGHLKLQNVTLIYDDNEICLDGPTKECFTEDVGARYRAYGWHVIRVDGHDVAAIDQALTDARQHPKPVLIMAKTTIGQGAPTVSNTSEAHGKPLGLNETQATKAYHGIPPEPLFYVDPAVMTTRTHYTERGRDYVARWNRHMDEWQATHPRMTKRWAATQSDDAPAWKQTEHAVRTASIKPNAATRAISHALIQVIVDNLPNVLGGSADLSCSDSTGIVGAGIISANQYEHPQLKYGVREFAMASIANGLALHGGILPYIGTFLTFSDYCRNAIRLAALMRLRVVYQLTHDSVFLGEDGPTHQPVEHVSSLRAMPGLNVIRPADQTETKAAWIAALRYAGPTALILTRQAIVDLAETNGELALRGGYSLTESPGEGPLDCVVCATGSEVSLAMQVMHRLEAKGQRVRVVSMPCFELFNQQSGEYRASVLPRTVGIRVAIEAGVSFGWHAYVGHDGLVIGVDQFGYSGTADQLRSKLGFTVDAIVSSIERHSDCTEPA